MVRKNSIPFLKGSAELHRSQEQRGTKAILEEDQGQGLEIMGFVTFTLTTERRDQIAVSHWS